VAMSIMAGITVFIPDMIYPFGIGVFCTSFGDGFAAVIGQLIKRHNPKIYGNKSVFGSVVNFAVSFFVPYLFSVMLELPLEIYHCLLIAVLSCELELFCSFGLDNIVITVGTSLLSYAFIYYPPVIGYIVPILVTPIIIALSYKKSALTRGGIVAAILLDALISVSLGNFGFTTLMTFFVVAVAIDKVKKRLKRKKGLAEADIEKKGDCRDSVQVLANGLSAAIFALLYLIFDNKLFVIAFVASLAEALADTAASGIGSLSKRVYDVFRMRKCVPGESGGMSVVGTVTSVIGALLVAFVAFAFGALSLPEVLVAALAAFLGGVVDSMLGSLIQVKYKCPVCGKIVEREEHCGALTLKCRGIRIFNNDTVNFVATAFSGAFSILLAAVLI
jgi:uncharacterized protein (TIGR00297 family)